MRTYAKRSPATALETETVELASLWSLGDGETDATRGRGRAGDDFLCFFRAGTLMRTGIEEDEATAFPLGLGLLVEALEEGRVVRLEVEEG